jgi:hypothetical protein
VCSSFNFVWVNRLGQTTFWGVFYIHRGKAKTHKALRHVGFSLDKYFKKHQTPCYRAHNRNVSPPNNKRLAPGLANTEVTPPQRHAIERTT